MIIYHKSKNKIYITKSHCWSNFCLGYIFIELVVLPV